MFLLNLRHKLVQYVLPEEYKKIAVQRDAFNKISADYRASIDSIDELRLQAMEDVKESIPALVRAQLKGFDPKLLDSDTDVPEVLGDVEAQDSFLAKMRTLRDTEELWVLIAYLTRNQVLYSAKEGVTLDQINFGRATINGWALLREEIDRLATVYADRHAATPEFDEHEVV